MTELTGSDPWGPSTVAQVMTSATPPYRITGVNNAWVQLCGYSASEALGRTCKMLQSRETVEHTSHALRQLHAAINEQRGVSVRLVNRKKSGELFLNELTLVVLRDKIGRVAGFRGNLVPLDMRDLEASLPASLPARAPDPAPAPPPLSTQGSDQKPPPSTAPNAEREAASGAAGGEGERGDDGRGGDSFGATPSVAGAELLSRDAFPLQTLHSHPISPVLLRMLQLNNMSSMDGRAMLNQLTSACGGGSGLSGGATAWAGAPVPVAPGAMPPPAPVAHGAMPPPAPVPTAPQPLPAAPTGYSQPRPGAVHPAQALQQAAATQAAKQAFAAYYPPRQDYSQTLSSVGGPHAAAWMQQQQTQQNAAVVGQLAPQPFVMHYAAPPVAMHAPHANYAPPSHYAAPPVWGHAPTAYSALPAPGLHPGPYDAHGQVMLPPPGPPLVTPGTAPPQPMPMPPTPMYSATEATSKGNEVRLLLFSARPPPSVPPDAPRDHPCPLSLSSHARPLAPPLPSLPFPAQAFLAAVAGQGVLPNPAFREVALPTAPASSTSNEEGVRAMTGEGPGGSAGGCTCARGGATSTASHPHQPNLGGAASRKRSCLVSQGGHRQPAAHAMAGSCSTPDHAERRNASDARSSPGLAGMGLTPSSLGLGADDRGSFWCGIRTLGGWSPSPGGGDGSQPLPSSAPASVAAGWAQAQAGGAGGTRLPTIEGISGAHVLPTPPSRSAPITSDRSPPPPPPPPRPHRAARRLCYSPPAARLADRTPPPPRAPSADAQNDAAHDEVMQLYGILDMLDNWDEFEPPEGGEQRSPHGLAANLAVNLAALPGLASGDEMSLRGSSVNLAALPGLASGDEMDLRSSDEERVVGSFSPT